MPSAIRFVITLDADTQLPRGAAARLVGTLAHPLNRPRLEPREGRVVEGYGILQPRIAPTLPTEREGSLFRRVFAGPAGVDPYAAAVSDVYQDLFAEGSYTGKGIYDVDAFERALEGRVPENSLLSHDLFEGLFARAALVTDIELFEDFPSRYEVGGGASASLGARRLAALAVADPRRRRRRRRARPDPDDRPLEDARQPAANALGSRRLPHARAGMDLAGRRSAGLDEASAHLPRGAGTRAGVDGDHSRGARAAPSGPICAASAAAWYSPARSSRSRPHLSRAPGLAHGRRRRPHLATPRRDPPANARVDHGRAGEIDLPARPGQHVYSEMWGARGARAHRWAGIAFRPSARPGPSP